jgi:hypothetical protein
MVPPKHMHKLLILMGSVRPRRDTKSVQYSVLYMVPQSVDQSTPTKTYHSCYKIMVGEYQPSKSQYCWAVQVQSVAVQVVSTHTEPKYIHTC